MRLGAVTFALSAVVLIPGEAQAYLDPGTGSFVLQAILGAAFGAAFTAKVYWSKIKAFFSKSTAESSDGSGDSSV